MHATAREYFKRYPRLIGGAVMALALAPIAAFLPQSLHHAAFGALIVLFGVYYAWAVTTVPKRSTPPTAPLTIRDHFKRTRGLLIRVGVPLAIAWIVGVDLYPSTLTKNEREGWAMGGGAALIIAAVFLIKERFKCPRCRTNFKHERWAQLGRWSTDMRNPEDMWDACPSCGVSFNDPYSP
jgi:hypothetical protein